MSNLIKAVVLARGLGTRMRRADAEATVGSEQSKAADRGLKAMIPVGRPFLDYGLSALADAGVREICLVIGPEHDAIREYYEKQPMRRIALHYAIQQNARGTADAVLAAEAFASADEFAVLNSDNYYPAEALRTLRSLDGPGTVLFDRHGLLSSNIPPERVRAFAVAEVRKGLLVGLIEKPRPGVPIAEDALISMTLWRFSPEIFEHCRQIEKSERGEYELPAAVVRAIAHGMRLRVARSGLGVLDLTQRSDIPAVAQWLRGIEVSL